MATARDDGSFSMNILLRYDMSRINTLEMRFVENRETILESNRKMSSENTAAHSTTCEFNLIKLRYNRGMFSERN